MKMLMTKMQERMMWLGVEMLESEEVVMRSRMLMFALVEGERCLDGYDAAQMCKLKDQRWWSASNERRPRRSFVGLDERQPLA